MKQIKRHIDFIYYTKYKVFELIQDNDPKYISKLC